MGLANVASTLWREREALQLLLFKLEEEQLVLAAGRVRWLEHAVREVELMRDQVRQTEVLRAVEVDAAAAALGLPPNPSLRALAAAAPAPWNDVLTEHRIAFLELTAEIAAAVEANRELLAAGQPALPEAVCARAEPAETHDGGATALAVAPLPRLAEDLDNLHQPVYRAALGATATVLQPSLVDFLR